MDLIERLRRMTEAHLDLDLDLTVETCTRNSEIKPPSEEWCREVYAGCQCSRRKGHKISTYDRHEDHRCRECRRTWT